jgi:hypothetical protein
VDRARASGVVVGALTAPSLLDESSHKLGNHHSFACEKTGRPTPTPARAMMGILAP